MTVRKRLLAKGIFPKELPPAFESDKYAKAVEQAGFSPSSFPALPHASLSHHSLARAGGVRRLLSFANPIAHFRLAEEIAQNWTDLRLHFHKPGFGLSRPALRNTMGRAVAPSLPFSALPRLRAYTRRHGRYLLLADIAEYYRTIYTHSISWALHTKAVAHLSANHRNYSLLGVRIDRALRNCQSRQTNGIPIGPDTSFVVGEILLAAIDQEILKATGPLSGFRFYDDFELVFERYSDAEKGLAALHSALGDYNLQLNPNKTEIKPLPLPLDNPWRDQIRRYEFGITDEAKQRSLLGYFDLVFSLKQMYPNDTVVPYAISRLESVSFESWAWSTLQLLLFQTMSVEPSSLQQVAVMFAKASAEGHVINHVELSRAITLTVQEHAIMGHGSEVAWALWMALSFSCRIDDRAALGALAKMDDSAVALLSLDLYSRGLLPGLDLTYWSTFMTADDLYGHHWLLAYEARVRNWIGTRGGGDHIAGDPAFSFLRTNRVRFYKQVRKPTARSTAEIPNWRTQYGIATIHVTEF